MTWDRAKGGDTVYFKIVFVIAIALAIFTMGALTGLDTARSLHCGGGPYRIDQGQRIVCQQLIDTKGGGQ